MHGDQKQGLQLEWLREWQRNGIMVCANLHPTIKRAGRTCRSPILPRHLQTPQHELFNPNVHPSCPPHCHFYEPPVFSTKMFKTNRQWVVGNNCQTPNSSFFFPRPPYPDWFISLISSVTFPSRLDFRDLLAYCQNVSSWATLSITKLN